MYVEINRRIEAIKVCYMANKIIVLELATNISHCPVTSIGYCLHDIVPVTNNFEHFLSLVKVLLSNVQIILKYFETFFKKFVALESMGFNDSKARWTKWCVVESSTYLASFLVAAAALPQQ